MEKDKRFSDEFLNAFVDNQLAAEEKSAAYLEIGQDQALNRQVCELRKMHDLVQLAYRDIPPPPARNTSSAVRKHGWRFGFAASFLLGMGFLLGVQLTPKPAGLVVSATDSPDQPVIRQIRSAQTGNTVATTSRKAATSRPVARVASPAPEAVKTIASTSPSFPEKQTHEQAIAASTPGVLPPVTTTEARGKDAVNKILVHLNDDNVHHLGQALEDIEGLMRYYRDRKESAHVEVVMNGHGLDLVRADVSRFSQKVAQLQKEYDNLTFAACQNTIDRLKREQGISVRLLPGVIVIDSGMAEIMRRQNQGWTYLQV